MLSRRLRIRHCKIKRHARRLLGNMRLNAGFSFSLFLIAAMVQPAFAQNTIPSIRGNSVGSTASSQTRTTTISAVETAEEALDADLKEAVSMLQNKQFVLFTYDFLPAIMSSPYKMNFFPPMSSPQSQSKNNTAFNLPNEMVADLLAHLESAQTGLYTFNRNKTLVEINYIRKAVELIPAAAPPYVPKIADRPTGPITGLGHDFQQMLLTAAKLLVAGRHEQFIRSVYPLAELARLEEDDLMERRVATVSSQPDMAAAMLRDLKAISESRITIDGSLAQAKLPPLTAGDEARVVKFELIEGNWRLFDGGRETRDRQRELVTAMAGSHTIPGSRGTMILSYKDGSWRLIGMPTSEPLF